MKKKVLVITVLMLFLREYIMDGYAVWLDNASDAMGGCENEWIDGAADVLARKHCLQENYVKQWIIDKGITVDQIEKFYKMKSADMLQAIYGF
ncbi:hypothetical protein LCGC14_1083760 [marine sediment metagenome]|uniref:Uncharacterized protein n=1 Tax=marine sediment metagenome TaxID=412755 RepID=A0A0F9MEL2_9ZZZZ